MAVYCSKDCERVGPICDFCKHFIVQRDKEGVIIDGSGICEVSNEEVVCGDFCEDDYVCRNVEE